MYNPQYLTQSRHGIYYLRFPIPQSLHPQRRQSSIKLSLQTRCPSEALHMGRALCYVGELFIKEGVCRMDYHDIREVLYGHFKAVREKMKARINTQGRLAEPDIAAYVSSQKLANAELKSENYDFIATDEELARVMSAGGFSIALGTPAYETFRTEYLKAYRDYCGSVLEYDARFDKYTFSTDPKVLTVKEATRLNRKKKLADSIHIYCAEKLRLKHWTASVEKEFRSKFALLLRYLGEEAPLNISPETAVDVKHMLSRIPSNASKKHQDKNIHELMEMDGKKLSPVTVNKYLQAYGSFYAWAVKRKEVHENHFEGLLDNVSKAKKDRNPFTQDEAQRILNAAMTEKKGHRKWGVFLAFYTGARLNELAQLDVADILEVDGIHCISINNNGDSKRLKNDASERTLPLHPKLIELGFLKYVQSQQANGRLFPELSYCPKNGYGRNLGRWFNTVFLRDQLKLHSKEHVFHSIRHTVAQYLSDKDVQASTIQAILGQAPKEVLHKHYARKLDKKVMFKALQSLDYHPNK